MESKEYSNSNFKVSVSEDGIVSGSVSVETNLGTIEMPINNETLNLYEARKVNAEDPNSCEREPGNDEIKVPISRDLNKSIINRAFGWVKYDEYSHYAFRMLLRGYNNIVMPIPDYKEMVQYISEKESKNERKQHIRTKYNAGINYEKQGEFTIAETMYYECIRLDNQFFDAYNRLITMYHRNKEYAKEQSVLQRAVAAFQNYEKWAVRLSKLSKRI